MRVRPLRWLIRVVVGEESAGPGGISATDMSFADERLSMIAIIVAQKSLAGHGRERGRDAGLRSLCASAVPAESPLADP